MGNFEDDLKKVRLEGKASGFDWIRFLTLDTRQAMREFIKENLTKFSWTWDIRTYRDFKRLFFCLNDLLEIPDPQNNFYSISDEKYKVSYEVIKRKAGFGHCKIKVVFSWPFIVYYRRVVSIDEPLVNKEFQFKKEFVFEFGQCGKTAKWIINELIIKFFEDRFNKIEEMMKNPPIGLDEI